MVVSVGIDVSKKKHDCFIVSSKGKVLANMSTILNNAAGLVFVTENLESHYTARQHKSRT